MIARSDLTLQRTFTFETVTGMGWGITSDGVSSLIVSDGSSTLLFWDPDTLIRLFRHHVYRRLFRKGVTQGMYFHLELASLDKNDFAEILLIRPLKLFFVPLRQHRVFSSQ